MSTGSVYVMLELKESYFPCRGYMVFWPLGTLPPPRLEWASHSKPLTTSVSTSHGMQHIHLESKVAKASHQFHRGVDHRRRHGLVHMAVCVEKSFFILCRVRFKTFPPLAKAWP